MKKVRIFFVPLFYLHVLGGALSLIKNRPHRYSMTKLHVGENQLQTTRLHHDSTLLINGYQSLGVLPFRDGVSENENANYTSRMIFIISSLSFD